ncbi:exported hypothetical protein [Xenorhabdus bovienii str. kraussei Quebec]|uniref:Uncharacterized protein n=1 Tax=Xenorhabdus bovienii str. kraussei Quebec TaxID=1398203 RepID=A0A077PCN2_XENBV|nr:exported hypothetical protein [Xenorhabdus bovienii str. kraussei Quebec]
MANTAEAASGLLSGLFAMIGLLSSFIGMSFLIALTGLIAMKRIQVTYSSRCFSRIMRVNT